MQIKNITINGLHGVNKSYDFGNHNYLFGRNGAGKSTVMQAIQFCLLGYIPGTSKTKDAILKHSPSGSISVSMQLGELDTYGEYEIVRTMNGLTSDVKITKLCDAATDIELESLIKDIELPIFNFDEFVGQTANKLKEYFIKHILPVSNGKINWGELLSGGVDSLNFEDKDATIQYGLDLIKDVIIDIESSPLDQVVKANAIFKDDVSFHKSEIARLQGAIDSLVYYDDYSGPVDIAEIDAQLLEYKAIRDALLRYEAVKDTYDRRYAELQSLKSSLQEVTVDTLQMWQETIAESNNVIHSMESRCIDLDVKKDACQSRIAYLTGALSDDGKCPYTKDACDSLDKIRADYANELDTLTQQLDSIKVDRLEYKIELDTYYATITQYRSSLDSYSTKTDRISALEKELEMIPSKPNTDMTIQELDFLIGEYESNKIKVNANTQYNAAIDKFTKVKYEFELRLSALKNWVKLTDTNGLQTTLMSEPFEKLANTMSGYIKKMYGRDDVSAHFNVTTKANSFSFGLIRNNVYIPYDMLSSGEKCLYVIALMICITYNSKSPLKLIMIDDALDHLDDIAADSTFRSIGLISDVQFIMAGVKDCNSCSDIKIEV